MDRKGDAMIKHILKWQFFLGVFIGLVLGAVLGTFLFMKNIDIFDVRKRQTYLIKEVEELRKERQAIMYNLEERGLIKEWNEEAVVKPEEGK